MFVINKQLQIPVDPINLKAGVDLIILEKAEQFLQRELRNQYIKLFAVNYKEIKSPDSRYRRFHVISATNQKDK